MHVGDLNASVKLNTSNFDRGIAGIQSKFMKVTQAAMQLNQTFELVGRAMNKVADPFREIVSVGGDFQQTMMKVKAVSRANEDQFKRLSASAKQMGATTMWTASESADALQFLAMAGFKVNDAIEALPGVLQLATAGAVELGRAADVSSNILSAFAMEAGQLGRVNDALVGTFTRTNTDLNMMAESMKYVSSLAHSLGYDIEETSAMIGILGNSGIQGSMAGTQLAAAFGEMQKVFKKLGVNGEGMKFVDVLKMIKREAWSTDEIMEAFGKRSERAVLTLIDRVGEIENLTDTLHRNNGEAAQVAATMEQGVNMAFKNLGSAVESVRLGLFDIFKDDMEKAVRSMASTVRDNRENIVGFFEDLYLVVKHDGGAAVKVMKDFNDKLDKMNNKATGDRAERARALVDSFASGALLPGGSIIPAIQGRAKNIRGATGVHDPTLTGSHTFRSSDLDRSMLASDGDSGGGTVKPRYKGVEEFTSKLQKLQSVLKSTKMGELEAQLELIDAKYAEIAAKMNDGKGANPQQLKELQQLADLEKQIAQSRYDEEQKDQAHKNALQAQAKAKQEELANARALQREQATLLKMVQSAQNEMALKEATKGLKGYDRELAELEFKYKQLLELHPKFKEMVTTWRDTEAAMIRARQAADEYKATVEGGLVEGMRRVGSRIQTTGEYIAQGWENTANVMADSFNTVFADGVEGSLDSVGEYATNLFKNIAKMLGSMVSQMMAYGLINAIGGSLFGGGTTTNPASTVAVPTTGIMAAHGAAFGRGGKLMPFARGGIVSSPTIFPFASGIGLMGEAGAEAIMPLTRLPNGNLGVESANGGSREIVINVENKSGQNLEVTQARSQMDTQREIITLVMDAVGRNVEGSGRFFGKI